MNYRGPLVVLTTCLLFLCLWLFHPHTKDDRQFESPPIEEESQQSTMEMPTQNQIKRIDGNLDLVCKLLEDVGKKEWKDSILVMPITEKENHRLYIAISLLHERLKNYNKQFSSMSEEDRELEHTFILNHVRSIRSCYE